MGKKIILLCRFKKSHTSIETLERHKNSAQQEHILEWSWQIRLIGSLNYNVYKSVHPLGQDPELHGMETSGQKEYRPTYKTIFF